MFTNYSGAIWGKCDYLRINMVSFARSLIVLGVILIVVGGLIYLVSRIALQFGQLPGDIRIQGENLTCVVPLATSILLSVVLTILLNIAIKLIRK